MAEVANSLNVDEREETRLHPAICRLGHQTLDPSPQDEATLYVRGFMSSVRSPAEQAGWRRNHDQIVQSYGRGGDAFDYDWQHHRSAGLPEWMPSSMAHRITSMGYYPLPLCASALVARRISCAVLGQRLPVACRPSRIALAFAVDVVANGVRVYTQWNRATANAQAPDEVQRLRGALLALHSRYRMVRIVSYSLGCRLTLRACPLLPRQCRPDEVHLVAAAVAASEARSLLGEVSRGTTHVYFSRDDQVLSLLYGIAAGSPALGYEGVVQQPCASNKAQDLDECEQSNYEAAENVIQHDASLLVKGLLSTSDPLAMHLMYSRMFHEVAYGRVDQRKNKSCK